ncbi:MAG: hypothetical protein ACFFAO_00415 [Candidatus Hermodarchaeota archaeon]
MKKIIIYDYKQGRNEHHILTAEINKRGDLIFSGCDSGDSVKEWFGDFDFEYWTTVKCKHVPEVLLSLIKERFHTNEEFKKWLDYKKIVYDIMSI